MLIQIWIPYFIAIFNIHPFIILVKFSHWDWPVLSSLSPPTLPIPCILLHNSPLSHVLLYHINPSFQWPASLSSSYFQLQHLISTFSSLLTICLNHLNHFCLKCSFILSTPTLDAITVLSTLSFNITPQIILSILLSVACSL